MSVGTLSTEKVTASDRSSDQMQRVPALVGNVLPLTICLSGPCQLSSLLFWEALPDPAPACAPPPLLPHSHLPTHPRHSPAQAPGNRPHPLLFPLPVAPELSPVPSWVSQGSPGSALTSSVSLDFFFRVKCTSLCLMLLFFCPSGSWVCRTNRGQGQAPGPKVTTRAADHGAVAGGLCAPTLGFTRYTHAAPSRPHQPADGWGNGHPEPCGRLPRASQ